MTICPLPLGIVFFFTNNNIPWGVVEPLCPNCPLHPFLSPFHSDFWPALPTSHSLLSALLLQCAFVREPCFLLKCSLLVCFPVSPALLLRPSLASQYWTAARLSPRPLFYSPHHLVISSLPIHGNLLTAPLPNPYKVQHFFLLLGHDPFQVITFLGDNCNSPLNFPSASFLTLRLFLLKMTRGAKLWICKPSYWFLAHAEPKPLLSSGISSPVPLSFPSSILVTLDSTLVLIFYATLYSYFGARVFAPPYAGILCPTTSTCLHGLLL